MFLKLLGFVPTQGSKASRTDFNLKSLSSGSDLLFMQVWLKDTFRSAFRMTATIAAHRSFATQITDLRHNFCYDKISYAFKKQGESSRKINLNQELG